VRDVCGICGIYDPNAAIEESALKRMTNVLTHRGPDRDGFYVGRGIGLGYRRLSIIDIPTGDQPISNEDGTVWVVFNGELYNYKALRGLLEQEGHRFRTQSDTEVLVHAYEVWGLDLLAQLNGMFAFALWDERNRRLFLARDRLGVKPLYYHEVGRQISFASELKALILDGRPPFDVEAIVDYLSFANCFGRKTMFRGIRRLLPGEYLLASEHGAETHVYWDLTFAEPSVKDVDSAVRGYLTLLEDSVAMELMSDVPLGAQLSGGMDSSAVVVVARKHMDSFDTFSVRFPEDEFDESPYARRVAELVGSRHHEVTARPSVVPSLLPRILYHLDEPRAGPGVIPQWLVAELASRHVRVVLTGHGGDELFAGYPSYYAAYVNQAILHGDVGSLFKGIGAFGARFRTEGVRRMLGLPVYALLSEDLRRYGHEAVFPPSVIEKLLAPALLQESRGYDPRTHLDAVLARCESEIPLSRLQYLDVKTYLPSLLDNEDRVSMAYSLESRVPILDHRIAAFAAKISPDLLVRDFTLKFVPRRALREYCPREVIEHRKMGFPVPISEWLRNDLASWVSRVLDDGKIRETGVLNADTVHRLVDAHLSGRADFGDQLWVLLNLELWLQGSKAG